MSDNKKSRVIEVTIPEGHLCGNNDGLCKFFANPAPEGNGYIIANCTLLNEIWLTINDLPIKHLDCYMNYY